MKDIEITFKEAVIVDFSTKNGEVEFMIYFNDKATRVRSPIDDPEEMAADILKSIRRKIREYHSTDAQESLVDNIVTVRITDEETVEKKLAHYLGKVADAVHHLRNASAGQNYLQGLNAVKSMKVVF